MTESDSTPAAVPPCGCPAIRRVMMPRDTNALGTIFGGVILSEIDLAAAIEAHVHWPHRVVTVAMDGIEFHQPVHVGDLVSFYTSTEKVGRSSIRVKVAVWARRRLGGGDDVYVTVAYVTMVAVDDELKPVVIPK
jgi:acyl-CoA thioesterase YciA